MFTKDQVENILVESGLQPTAPDEEIRSALLKMNWQSNDVEAALVVLRENVDTNVSRIDAVHKIFNTDAKLSPETITSLLGIKVEVKKEDLALSKKRARGGLTINYMLEVVVVSLLLSLILAFGAMWLMKVGVFHQTML